MYKKLILFWIVLLPTLFMTGCEAVEKACAEGEGGFLCYDAPEPYCESHKCLPLGDKVHRPMTLQLTGVHDNSDKVILRLLSCELLPGENPSKIEPACADSIRLWDSTSLKKLIVNKPRFSYYDEYIHIPVDSSNHIRFSFVDINRDEKIFDIDLNAYTSKMHHKSKDTIRFTFPEGLEKFEGLTLDKDFDKDILPAGTEYEEFDSCSYVQYDYEEPLDSTLECRSYQPWVKKEDMKKEVREGFTWRTVQNAADCISPDTMFVHYRNWESKYLGCYHYTINKPLTSLTLIDYRSTKKLKEKYDADYAEKHFTSLSYDTWKALFRVSGQGPDKQDTLLIEVQDNYSWDE